MPSAMYTGTTLLLLSVGLLILIGAAQRVLDRMRLSRTTALLLVGVMAAGTFLPELRFGPGASVDPGGALVPAGVAVYLLVTADRAFERRRALVATLWTAAVIYATDWLLPSDPGGGRLFVLDPVWLPTAIAAFFGYLAGRSRRSAFIAATLGLVLVDLVTVLFNALRGIPGALVSIGGGGILDAVAMAGVGAVALAELFGETREWLARRAARRGARTGSTGPGSRREGLAEPRPGSAGEPPRGAGEPGGGEEVRRGEEPRAPGVAASWGLAGAAVGVILLASWLGPRFHNPAGDELLGQPMRLMELGTGRLLLATSRIMRVGDVWIDAADTWYRIVRVDGQTAYARSILQPSTGTIALEPATGTMAGNGAPDRWPSRVLFSPARLALPGNVPVLAGLPAPGPQVLAATVPAALFQKVSDPAPAKPAPRGKGIIGIYHTHNDESYIPTDGTESVEGRGGIHAVGDVLGRRLARHGYHVIKSEALHLPHDRGAYRRSRRTAIKMLPKNPVALLDVHRDATPPEFYRAEVKGKPVTQVRLVVGRENPFHRTNLEFARRLKAEAARTYPGLVKGIYIGLGGYNQDLGPRTLLAEFGAHTNSRREAEQGAAFFADVLAQTLAQSR
ncbi:MAG TPA: stage II sporulation protein P [Thermaerobacter sp.]